MAAYTIIYDSRRWVRSDSTDTTVLLPVAAGGSGANLSATGGANQFVKQSTTGGVFTVATIGAGDVPDVALTSNVALLNRNAQNFTGTYDQFVSIGVGGAPTNIVDVFQNQNAASTVRITNSTNNTASQSYLEALSDTAAVSIRAHATARVAARYGVTLGGYAELIGSTGNGLIVGTIAVGNLIFGTNASERLRFDSAGNTTFTSLVQQPFAPTDLTIATGKYAIVGDECAVTGTNALAIVGTGVLTVV